MSSYRVHKFDLTPEENQEDLERFLNDLDGEVVSIVPHVTMRSLWIHWIDFLYIVEKLP